MKLGFKLGGGAGLLFNGGGDIEKVRLGREAWTADWGTEGYDSSFTWNKAPFAGNFNFDVILGFGRNFGVSLGFGYLSLGSKGDYSLNYQDSGSPWWGTWYQDIKNEYTHDFKTSAFAIPVNFYFFMPMGGMTFYGFGGLGFYMGRFSHDYTYDFNDKYYDTSWYYIDITDWTIKYNDTIAETAKANALGFQGGAGLKINFSRAVGIAFEMFGRFVNFKNWTGDYNYDWSFSEKVSVETYGQIYNVSASGSGSESGSLWFYEYYDSTLKEI